MLCEKMKSSEALTLPAGKAFSVFSPKSESEDGSHCALISPDKEVSARSSMDKRSQTQSGGLGFLSFVRLVGTGAFGFRNRPALFLCFGRCYVAMNLQAKVVIVLEVSGRQHPQAPTPS